MSGLVALAASVFKVGYHLVEQTAVKTLAPRLLSAWVLKRIRSISAEMENQTLGAYTFSFLNPPTAA